MKESEGTENMEPKKKNWGMLITFVLVISLAAASLYAAFQLSNIGVLNQKMLLISGFGIFMISLIVSLILVWTQEKRGWKWLARIISVVLCTALATGGNLVGQLSSVISMISTNQADKAEKDMDKEEKKEEEKKDLLPDAQRLSQSLAISLTTYALNETELTEPAQLNSKRVGVSSALDEEGTKKAIEQLNSKGAQFETVEFDTVYSLADGLLQKQVDAIILPEQYHRDLLDAANDINQYNALTTFSNVVDTYTYYTDLPEEMKNPADPVNNIKQDPFVVLISGNDSYGTLSAGSRSDVNMLAVVNPKTYQVLLVSVPRDAYLPVACKSQSTACQAAAGYNDKLTHTGIYGIGSTEATLENFLGIPINYTVLVNFSSLMNIVDALGGVDVYVEEGLEVDTFYANGTPGVQAGWNHLEGERTLGFVRERHAYLDGDNQRIRNQQIVLEAIINALKSPTSFFKYPAVLDVLPTAISTNMSSDQIREFLALEVEKFPNWQINSVALTGSPTMDFSFALGQNASVSVIADDQKQLAVDAITKVLNGESLKQPETQAEGTSTEEVSEQTDQSKTEGGKTSSNTQ